MASQPPSPPRHSDFWRDQSIQAAQEGWPGYYDAILNFNPQEQMDAYGEVLGPIPGEPVGAVLNHWSSDTFGVQITPYVEAVTGDVVLGRQHRMVQLATNRFSSRYIIMRRMENTLEILQAPPPGNGHHHRQWSTPANNPANARGQYSFRTVEMFLRIDIITQTPPKELPLNLRSYLPTAVKIHSKIMSQPTVDRSQESQFIRALWLVLEAASAEEFRLRSLYREDFDMHRFVRATGRAFRATHILPLVQNPDGSVAIIRPPLVKAVQGQLMSYLDLLRFMTSCPDPFARLRPWRQPADAVVAWWRTNLPDQPVDALWSVTDRALMEMLARVHGYLHKKDEDRIINAEAIQARELAAREAQERAQMAMEATWANHTPDSTNRWYHNW